MEGRNANLLSFCSSIDFGTVNFSQEEEEFRDELNHEMLSLCKFLPKSMQREAFSFLVHYLHTSIADGLNFVRFFYAPAWSILFWLMRSCPDTIKLDSKDIEDAKTAHTMAMFLHALDDHLTDGQWPVTHLTLLIRSQAWVLMNKAFERIAQGVDKGPAIVSDFIDDYYSSIGKSDQTESLNSYCDFFRKQMATWLIVPVLLARKISTDRIFADSIQTAYGSFGIAWRLLDDLQDIEKDMTEGARSSIYVSLSEELRSLWDKNPEKKKDQNNDDAKRIRSYVLENRVIDTVKERTCSELESAASTADSCHLTGFGDELRSLLRPLKNRENGA